MLETIESELRCACMQCQLVEGAHMVAVVPLHESVDGAPGIAKELAID